MAAVSQDMFPLEHLCDVMDHCVQQHPHPPANQQKLIQTLQREWLCIPNDL